MSRRDEFEHTPTDLAPTHPSGSNSPLTLLESHSLRRRSPRPWCDGNFHRLSARAARTSRARHRPVHTAALVRIVARQVAHHSRDVLRRPAVRAAREARIQRLGRAAGAIRKARAHAHGRADDRGVGRRDCARRARECGRASPSVRRAERERTARPLPCPAPARRRRRDLGAARGRARSRGGDRRTAFARAGCGSRASVRREGHLVARDGRRSRSHHHQRDLCRRAVGDLRRPVDG